MTRSKLLKAGWLLFCTGIALLLLGYHPSAEDGGIYAAALQLRLNPGLFSASQHLVRAHLDHSLYLATLSAIYKLLPLSLDSFFLAAYCVSTFFTLLAAQKITALLCQEGFVQGAALLALSIGISLPVAGTALYIADPYLSARSLSTPLLLFAILYALRSKYGATLLLVIAAALLHPVMAVWGTLLVFAILAPRVNQRFGDLWLGAAWVLAFALVHLLSPHEDSLSQQLARSRSYWYISQWEWYEVVGFTAPPILLLLFRSRSTYSDRLRRAVLICFATTATLSLIAVHTSSNQLLLARIQPMRALHLGYIAFLLFLGVEIGSTLKQIGPRMRTALAVLLVFVASAGIFSFQRSIYPASDHLELPWRTPANPWVRAFLWARRNTPQDALFALDSDYIHFQGEDAQCFRAIALRSALPDRAKDGGAASVTKSLALEWKRGVEAQENLNTTTDEDRLRRLRPMHVSWIVLPARATTSFACPYANEAAKVCAIPVG